MKKLLIVIGCFLFCACTTTKHTSNSVGNSSLDDLVEVIIGEYFDTSEEPCLVAESVSFQFKFPNGFDGGAVELTKEEVRRIEDAFQAEAIRWKDFLQYDYRSHGTDCVSLSKPIFLRNGTLAFIYESHMSTYFYNIYQKSGSTWKLKENLITVFND